MVKDSVKVLPTISVSMFPGTIRGLSNLSLLVDVDSESEVMLSAIWVSVFPGTMGGLSHLSLALLSSLVSWHLLFV